MTALQVDWLGKPVTIRVIEKEFIEVSRRGEASTHVGFEGEIHFGDTNLRCGRNQESIHRRPRSPTGERIRGRVHAIDEIGLLTEVPGTASTESPFVLVVTSDIDSHRSRSLICIIVRYLEGCGLDRGVTLQRHIRPGRHVAVEE